LLLVGPAAASAGTITFTVGTEFSGGAQPSGSPTATITDTGANQVTLTLTSNLSGNEFIDAFYLNYSGDLSSLSVGSPTGTGANAFIGSSTGSNSFKADGDGFFDLLLEFMPPGDERFGAGESVSFVITGTGLSAGLFNLMSACNTEGTTGCGNGGYFAAAHVQAIDTPPGSGWVGDGTSSDNETPNPVPEPSTLLLLGSALGFGARKLRRHQATA